MYRTKCITLAAMLPLAFAATAHADTVIVNVGGNQPPTFSPQTISINVGDTVTFINKGGLHNVVADDSSFRCAHGCDGDGHGGNGAASSSTWVASISFTKAGKVGYYCEIHGAPGEGMFGTINVMGSQPPPAVSSIPASAWNYLAALCCAIVLAASMRLPRRRR
jgi:plastocyanin